MPFINVNPERPKKSFEDADSIILSEVFPILNWEEYGNTKLAPILPNCSLISDEFGPMEGKESRKYFALSCLNSGLSYSDIGGWLDYCLKEFCVRHTDGKERLISAEKETSLRFDAKKPIYTFNGIHRRYLVVRE